MSCPQVGRQFYAPNLGDGSARFSVRLAAGYQRDAPLTRRFGILFAQDWT